MSWTDQDENSDSWADQTTRLLVRVTEDGQIRCTEDGQIRCALVTIGHVWDVAAENADSWTVQ